MKINPADYALFSDDECADNDEYPTDAQMMPDIAIALQEYAQWERGERELRITERTMATPKALLTFVADIRADIQVRSDRVEAHVLLNAYHLVNNPTRACANA